MVSGLLSFPLMPSCGRKLQIGSGLRAEQYTTAPNLFERYIALSMGFRVYIVHVEV